MGATIEHLAASRRSRETHLKLARETGHRGVLAMLSDADEMALGHLEWSVGAAIRDAAERLGVDRATQLAMEAIVDLNRGRP